MLLFQTEGSCGEAEQREGGAARERCDQHRAAEEDVAAAARHEGGLHHGPGPRGRARPEEDGPREAVGGQ